jgi:multiple sugar transport system permease protein
MVATAATTSRTMAAKGTLRREETFWAYVFLAPWIVGLVVFIFGPMLFSLLLSFYTYTLGSETYTFVGLDNWFRALSGKDEFFWPSVWRTFLYVVGVVPLSVIGALGTAMLLNQGLRFTTFYRTVFFMPHLVPVVAAIYIWLWLLNGQFGLVNELLFQATYYLTGKGVVGPNYFGDTFWALPALMMISLWGAVGGNMMLIFLAGLQGIPQELYEAASIDGAGTWKRFWNVTLPLISPTMFFNSVLACIGAIQSFEAAFIGTGGGPAYSTWLYGLHIYRTTFDYQEMGYGSTLAWIMFIALSVFTYIQFRTSRSWVFYAGEGRDD